MEAEMTNGQSAHSGGAFPGGEAISKYRGQRANTRRTTVATEVFPAITFVNSYRVGIVSSPGEI